MTTPNDLFSRGVCVCLYVWGSREEKRDGKRELGVQEEETTMQGHNSHHSVTRQLVNKLGFDHLLPVRLPDRNMAYCALTQQYHHLSS